MCGIRFLQIVALLNIRDILSTIHFGGDAEGLEKPMSIRLGMDMSDANPLRQTRRSLPIALLRARETVMGPIRDMLATSGVNEQKWRVLRVLQEKGPLELSQVAHEACLLLSSLTRMVRPMESEGLIARTTPPQDRRKTIIAITPAGDALVRAHAAQSQAIFARIEAEYGAARLEQLLDLLADLQSLDLRMGR
jgi:homoprotocatechuate degradation regulator HpaR